MNQVDFVIAQAIILGVVSLVGAAFSYALPTPKHKHKANSGQFARYYLFCCWMIQVSLTFRHLDQMLLSVVGYQFFVLTAAYMLMMTVVKRYGHAITRKQTLLIIAHIGATVAFGVYFYLVIDNKLIRDVALLCGCAIPISLTIGRIKLLLHHKNSAELLLYWVLHATLILVVILLPVYLVFYPGSIAEHTTVSFGVLLILMMVFMLSFAVNVVHSLVHRLHIQMHTDPLTGAKNRHYFYDVGAKLSAHAARHQEHLCVVVCDIDHFKKVNDQYGHVVGDKALKTFSQLIQGELRKEDTLVRMGGEEFLILSPQCSVEQASSLAERLRKIIAETSLTYDGVEFGITASFGVREVSGKADFYAVVKEADEALIRAKSSGRNQVVTV